MLDIDEMRTKEIQDLLQSWSSYYIHEGELHNANALLSPDILFTMKA